MEDKKPTLKTFADYLQVYLKGCGMGVADLIPGISGGTIAFIFGIYENLVYAIRSFDIQAARSLLRGRLREALRHAHWEFLGTLLLGIMTSIFTLSKGLTWLLENKPVYLNAFFFGLIVATVPIIGRNIKKWRPVLVSVAVVSTGAMFVLVGLVPVQTPETPLFLFFSGALAICAMILPGISGSFILLLIGKYEYIIAAVSHHDFATLAYVAAGCVVGILAFVRVLSWLFHRYHDLTVAVLAGLVLGSLRKIWPWKETLQSMVDHKGRVIPIEQMNILPAQFSAEVLGALALAVIGFFIAWKIGLANPAKLTSR